MSRLRLPLLFLLLAPPGASAMPMTDVVCFDVDGDGSAEPAFLVQGVGNDSDPLLITHAVQLEAGRTYCMRFEYAIVNHENARTGRFRFGVDVDALHFEALSDPIAAGTVQRRVETAPFVAETTGETSIVIQVDHDTGPEHDPVLYLDSIEVVPLDARILESRNEQVVWMPSSTVVGWDHDFRKQGVRAGTFVGVAEVELLVWDDQPGPPSDGLEKIELTVNGVVLVGNDIGGGPGAPDSVRFSLPWIECRSDFDGFLHMRLRTISSAGEPPGDMWFGGATATLRVGQPERTVLLNGDFDAGADGWLCNGVRCAPTAVSATTWSSVKQLYRRR